MKYAHDSDAVLAIQNEVNEIDSSDWGKSYKRWLLGRIRAQRMREAQEIGTHTKEEWQGIIERFNFRCVRCGCVPDPRPCKDHIIPIGDGGSDAPSNLQPLCRQCNTSKGLERANWAKYREANGFERSCA